MKIHFTQTKANSIEADPNKRTMKIHFTQSIVNSIKADPNKRKWYTDDQIQNLKLYVGKTGVKTWLLYYYDDNGKKICLKLGPADKLTVTQARDLAKDYGGRIVRGEKVKTQKPTDKLTYGEFLKSYYIEWVENNRKSGKETIKSINRAFGFLMEKPLDELSIIEIEQWRTKLKNQNKKASTINRLVVALKASVNWAVKREIIEENPLSRLERLKEKDSNYKVRYLSKDERVRLFSALNAREEKIRAGRSRYNDWRIKRSENPLPELDGEFADYLKPMILISLHTGIRQGSLFGLKWEDIDFTSNTFLIIPEIHKPEKKLDLAMNSKVVKIFSDWKKQTYNGSPDSLIFPSPVTGKQFTDIKTAWSGLLKDADIKNFRWHDMRHDFASQLVMKGLDLNTVRELMGHADLKMTLRYAHLAPQNKLRAVEILVDDEL